MFCEKCGSELDEKNICPNCGARTAQGEEAQVEQNNGAEKERNEGTENTERITYSGKSIAGFVVSLAGLLAFAMPCGIIGAIFSSLGIKDTENLKRRGRGLAISGLVISIIDIIFGIVNIVGSF